MAEPAIAVVVVTHNSADHLAHTLDTVGRQLRDGDELVVVDNASSDRSVEVSAPRARVEAQPRNLGFAGGCNVGARATAAPLLLFLNPDATAAPDCLDRLRTGDPAWGAWQALVLMPGAETVNSTGGVVHYLGFGWAGDCGRPVAEARPGRRRVAFASGAALVVRREAWDRVGGFDDDYFMYGEDLDLSLRLRLAGYEVGIVPEARVEHAYEFHKGAYKWFWLERNRWWTVLGTYPLSLLVLLLPALLAFELALLPVAARGGWLGAKLRAQGAVLFGLGGALRRRRGIQRTRAIPVGAFADQLTASLDSPYLGTAARIRPLSFVQSLYWRGVRRLTGQVALG